MRRGRVTWNAPSRASLGINRPAFPVVPLPWFEVRVPQRPRVADEKARGPRGNGTKPPRSGAAGRNMLTNGGQD